MRRCYTMHRWRHILLASAGLRYMAAARLIIAVHIALSALRPHITVLPVVWKGARLSGSTRSTLA